MYRLLKFLFFFSFLMVTFLTSAQLYTFKNFNHRDGLTLSAILSVKESNDGYLWFGTDGAGLMRYDGQSFNYLEDIQGRTNRHVNHIDFAGDNIFFTTLYRKNYKLRYNQIEKLDYLPQYGSNHALINFQEKQVVVQDGGIFVFDDSLLLDEKKTFPYNKTTEYYGSYEMERGLFLFTSKGNYVITEEMRVENLHDWLTTSESVTRDLISAVAVGDSLVLTDAKLENELVVLMDDFRPKFFIQDDTKKGLLEEGEYIVSSDSRFDFTVFVSNQGRIFLRSHNGGGYYNLLNNSGQKIIGATDIEIDRNHDIWVTSKNSGIFRVSLEPFTQINFDEVYTDPLIMFIDRTREYDAIISTGQGETYIGNRYTDSEFKKYDDLRVYSMTRFREKNYLATNKGLKEVQNTQISSTSDFDIPEKPLSLVFGGKDYFWYAIEGQGLYRYNETTDSSFYYTDAPAYFYTCTFNEDSTKIYFGSNNGVYSFDVENQSFKKLPSDIDGTSLGSYAGNATMDIYGTVWFSLDEGIYGITALGELTAITAERFLPSTLIYTLNADNFGNLIVGTNKGITVVEVNEQGNALGSNTYNSENGFNGYETHMRSSYRTKEGLIFIGTLEGLFMIRPQYLNKSIRPIAPHIYEINNKDRSWYKLDDQRAIFDINDNNISLEFKCINAKTTFVKYSYKLLGSEDEEWSAWMSDQEVFLNNLDAGSYTFLVRATIDENLISNVSKYSFEIQQPFYRTKWFIILVIGFVIVANFLVLERTKRFNKKNIILSRDVGTDRRMAGSILLFGAFANTAAHVFASRIDNSIHIHDISAILVGGFVFGLFALLAVRKNLRRYSNEILILGFLTLLGYNHLMTFISDIHPFYLMATLLVSFVAPFVFRSLKAAIAFGFVLMLASVAVVFYLETAHYNQYLFLVGIGVAAFLAIFMTYLRNNSLERLIFTSGVVNKGNALVVAFDGKGKISYASENTEELLDVKSTLVGGYVSELNQFQPNVKNHKKFSNVDLKEDFQEGKIFVTPLFTKLGEIVYYQWSCKEFSDDVRVILGQDVTDKINLENYYELIVRNADDLIFQTDPQGNFTFVNEKCTEVFGRSSENLIGSSINSVVADSHRERVRDFYSKNFKERQRNNYLEFQIETPEGEKRWLGQNVTTLLKPGADNIVTGFLGLARDITEKRKANAIIEEQNKDITDSINYARRIQFNMLPRSTEFEKTFEEHFILFKPKDIVSGDFYWLNQVGDKTILICSDSTGHGVPGSFMTLLGINILNQIILEAKITDPGEIFNELDKRLIQVLPRDGQNRIKDGMEAVVCVFDNNSDEMQYSTAGGRFVITDDENNNITVVKGQVKHIGDEPNEDDFSYKTETISFNNKQLLYLFSDGYPDQFGGEKYKKLTIKKFLALLDALTPQDLQEQNEIFREHLSAWIGDEPQTDDITVIGIRGLIEREKNK